MKTLGLITSLTLLAPLAGCASSSSSSSSSDPVASSADPTTLARAVTQGYADAPFYQDTGTVDEVLRRDDGDELHTRVTFRTAFDRASGAFLFDYVEHQASPLDMDTHGVVWRGDSGPAKRWWTVTPRVEERDVREAVFAFQGVSHGTSGFVPRMLLGSRTFGEGLTLRPAGEERVRGVACVKLSGGDDSRTVTFWIGTEDHAVRRVFERSRFDGKPDLELEKNLPEGLSEEQRRLALDAIRHPSAFTSEKTIDYAPSFAGPVARDRFEFVPPPS